MSNLVTPKEITQNTTVEWTIQSDDYPASDGFTATFTLISASGNLSVDASTNSDGSSYDFALTPPTQTAALFPGYHEYQIAVDDGTDRYVIESGYILVLPDLATTQVKTVDGRTPTRQRYEAYVNLLTNEAYIKTMGPDQIAALEEMVRRLEWDLRREADVERAKRGENVSRKLYVRFK